MSEDGTAVLENTETEEERSPGGLFTQEEFNQIKTDIDLRATSRKEVVRDAEQTAVPQAPEPSSEPKEVKAADEPSREPEPVASEPVEPESTEPEVPEPAEPAEAKADEESPAAEFDDQLLARAEQMGFPKQAALSFGTPDKLEIALTVIDQRLIGLGTPKQVTAPPAVAPPVAPAPVVPPVQPAVQAVPVQAAPVLIEPLIIDLNEDEHDPAIVAQFNKLHAHYEARANQFEQVLVGMVTSAQSRAVAGEDQFIDKTIDAFDDSLKSLVTPEVRAQMKYAAKALKAAYSQGGIPLPGDEELVERAARGLLSKQLLENETKRVADELSAKLEKRAGQRTAKPVQHHSTEPGMTKKEKRRQRVKTIQAHLDERGMG